MARPARLSAGLLAGALWAASGLLPAAGKPLAAGSACGGNAYSSAQVIEGRPARHGPITSVPDTLCADLDGPRPAVNIDIYGVPGTGVGTGTETGSGTGTGIGTGGTGAPYGDQPRRRPWRPGPRD
ncbi:hypothetical protein [Methylobacterium sp. A54F]